ncbi:helix-turn-helix transcriptional regulator [Amphibacillus jilinensis]|uniref:helix-turn-helix transcriptional regulator n=1 Tax=Amphibacillus jilinensis TaxID=1216008 RepID=UPI0003058D5A|nr:helix-turn-helix domain-containing protein [Amphibacillus jilinensis]
MRQLLIEARGKESRPHIAEQLKITPQMLGAIERGDRTPSLLLAKKIADLYGHSIEDLFFNQNRNESFLLAKTI